MSEKKRLGGRFQFLIGVVAIISLFFPIYGLADDLKPITLKIDWIPSAEYYGIFYAKEKGFFKDCGFDVDIKYGQGAPVVAKEMAVGSLLLGTTSSENILIQACEGAKFALVMPLLKFNPNVIVSLPEAKINSLRDLVGKRLGAKVDTVAYQQYRAAMEKLKLNYRDVVEVPVGWSGKVALINKRVDAVVHYTTNLSVDLKLEGHQPHEIFLESKPYSQHSYGTVLAFAQQKTSDGSLEEKEMRDLAKAVWKGYQAGESDLEGCVKALQSAEKTLKNEKLRLAIRKIIELNKKSFATPENIDTWIKGVSRSCREQVKALYWFPKE